jgi:deoxyribonuclease V
MKLQRLHDWDVSPAAAIALQKQLAQLVVYDQSLDLAAVRTVAGVDVSVKDDVSQAAVVVMSFPELQVIEVATARQPTPFPYIPGLLSFREGPVLVHAFEKLRHVPEVFIFDGMGRAHPLRIGIASHMGLWLGKPTIGCGKTHLIGAFTQPDEAKGSASPLIDAGETIGIVLRTKASIKPVYVSVGHLADLTTSVELILRCTSRYRLPEPIRAAHLAAGRFA